MASGIYLYRLQAGNVTEMRKLTLLNSMYKVNLGTVAQDLYGTRLKTPYSFAFVTRPE